MKLTPSKKCIVCYLLYYKNIDSGYRDWDRRKYCSRKCMGLDHVGDKNPYKGTLKGEKSGMWKGDKVGYISLHQWVYRNKDKPTKCEECGFESLNRYKIQWANKSGEYKRDLNDWKALCVKCHFVYDGQNKRSRDENGRLMK